MSRDLYKCSLLIVLILCIFHLADSVVPNCRSTIGKHGVCKIIKNCAYTTQIERNRGRHSHQYQHYMNNNFCGFHGYLPTICCPIVKRKPTTVRPVSKTTKRPQVPALKKVDRPVIPPNKGNDNKNVNTQSLLPEKCGTKYDIRIIGGEVMKMNEFPWMVLLEYNNTLTGQMVNGCSGSLISKRYVLTAGHCLRAVPPHWSLTRVRLGEYNTETDLDCEPSGDGDEMKCSDRVLLVSIEREIVHEEYWKNRDFANDVALLRLDQDVPTTTDYIQPVCLPTDAYLANSYWAAGWGKTETRAQSVVKLKVTLPLFDFNECARLYSTRNITLAPGQICAGGQRGKDTCSGDSGGPLMRLEKATWIVDGIVSMGHSTCGTTGWPAVYTHVYKFVPWILSKLQP